MWPSQNIIILWKQSFGASKLKSRHLKISAEKLRPNSRTQAVAAAKCTQSFSLVPYYVQYHTISSKSSSRTLYKFRVSTFSWLNLMITNLRLKYVYRACVKIHSFLSVCAIFILSKQGPFHETYQSTVSTSIKGPCFDKLKIVHNTVLKMNGL